MNLQDLYEKHYKDIENFKSLKSKVWDRLIADQEAMIEGLGSVENMHSEYPEAMKQAKDGFKQEWDIPNGTRYKNMVLQHEEKIKAITDFLPNKDRENAKAYDNPVEVKQRSFLDKLASNQVLKEEAEKTNDISPQMDSKKTYEQNKDDMDLEID